MPTAPSGAGTGFADGSPAGSSSAGGSAARCCSRAASPSCSSWMRPRRWRPATDRARSAGTTTTGASSRSGRNITAVPSEPGGSTHVCTASASTRARSASAITRPSWQRCPTARSSCTTGSRTSCSETRCCAGRRRGMTDGLRVRSGRRRRSHRRRSSPCWPPGGREPCRSSIRRRWGQLRADLLG